MAVFITLVNFFMTLPAVYLIDVSSCASSSPALPLTLSHTQRLGRRALLLGSMAAMSFSSLVLAYSINKSMFLVASTFIVLMVASFSIGLGPVPFVLLGELPPPQVRSALPVSRF